MRNLKPKKKFVLGVAGGGSGGHSIPLLAIAGELNLRDSDADIFFVTTQKSVEEEIIRKKGYRYFKIPSGKLNGQSPVIVALTLLKLPIAIVKGIWIVWRNRPNVVVSAGGYAGAPFVMAASLMGVRTVIYEQNRMPGLAIRLMSRFAKLVLLNYESAKKNFPKNETHVVGLPCREDIAQARWTESDQRWSSEPFHIFVTGGSQGAMGLNRIVVKAMEELSDSVVNISMHHQTGKNDVAAITEAYQSLGLANVKVEAYVHDMREAFERANLVISRSGASTLVELAAAEKASILVPLVSQDNHQVSNAKDCESAGAASLVLQSEDAHSQLAAQIRTYMIDREHTKAVAKKMGMRYVPGATSKILAYLFDSQ